MERYQRQIAISQIGESGQQKLLPASVVVIGAGGLGCPVLTYLVNAGVGNIRIIDCDIVSLSNLNRQFLHTEQDLGRDKTESAKEKLQAMNSNVHIETVHDRLTVDNGKRLLDDAQVVIDCVDSIETRLLVNKICIENDIPLVEGGISGLYGFVTAIRKGYPCLECMGYYKGMAEKVNPVLGATAGVIGSLQANECLKILLGIGDPLYGRMLQYDGLSTEFDEIKIEKKENCELCGVHNKE